MARHGADADDADSIDAFEQKSAIPNLDSWETLLFSTAPHPKSFIRLWASWFMLTGLWASVLIIAVLAVPVENRFFWWSCLLMLTVLTGAVYAQSRSMLGKNRVMIWVCNGWVVIFIVVVSLVLMKMIHTEIAATQTEWWEQFIGFPFTIASILFSILVFIISRVVWRLAYLTPKPYGFPLYVGSICLVLVSLYSLMLARDFDLLYISGMLNYLFLTFAVVSIAYSMLLVSFITHKGGIKYMMTTRRLVIYSTFLKNSSEDHVFDKVHDIELEQGFFGKRNDFGDLRVRSITVVETRKGEKLHMHSFALDGVPKPLLMKNTLMALTSMPLAAVIPVGHRQAPITLEKPGPAPPIARSTSVQQSPPQVIITSEYIESDVDEHETAETPVEKPLPVKSAAQPNPSGMPKEAGSNTVSKTDTTTVKPQKPLKRSKDSTDDTDEIAREYEKKTRSPKR